MDLTDSSDEEVQVITGPLEEIQLSAAEESAIEDPECLSDPSGSDKHSSSLLSSYSSLSSVDHNLLKKSMAKRREERRYLKFLQAASQADDEEDSQQSSSLSSISRLESDFDTRTPPTANTRKTPEDLRSLFNARQKGTEDQGIPSTSEDNNVIASSKGKNLTDLNEEKSNLISVTDATDHDVNPTVLLTPKSVSKIQAPLLTSRIPSVGKRYFEEEGQISDKKKQVEAWVQNNFNNETQIVKNNILEDELENKSSNILNSVEPTSNEVGAKANKELFEELQKSEHFVQQERKRNRSHLNRDGSSVSAPKKKMRSRYRSKKHIYCFFSSMADLVSTFSYESTLVAKSKMTEVLKEMEKELIEWHNDPSPDKPKAEFEISEEDIKKMSKKLAYLPYVY